MLKKIVIPTVLSTEKKNRVFVDIIVAWAVVEVVGVWVIADAFYLLSCSLFKGIRSSGGSELLFFSCNLRSKYYLDTQKSR